MLKRNYFKKWPFLSENKNKFIYLTYNNSNTNQSIISHHSLDVHVIMTAQRSGFVDVLQTIRVTFTN